MSKLQKDTIDGYKPVFAPNMKDLQSKIAEKNIISGTSLTLHTNLKII